MDPIVGQIILWPVPWVPQGWALCDGTVLSINGNQALFALIGNIYGGNGSTTFALPDLRSKVPLGTTAQNQVGQVNGATTSSVGATGAGAITITANNLPPHTHAATFTPGGSGSSVAISIPACSNPATNTNTDTPGTSTVLSVGSVKVGNLAPTTSKQYSSSAADTTLLPFNVNVPAGSGTVAVANTGNGQPIPFQVAVPVTVSTMQPSLTLNYIIALTGVFPSRP